jgi:hypothetical protein
VPGSTCPRCSNAYNGHLPLCGACTKELNFARKKLIRQGKYTEASFFTTFLAPYLSRERADTMLEAWRNEQ